MLNRASLPYAGTRNRCPSAEGANVLKLNSGVHALTIARNSTFGGS